MPRRLLFFLSFGFVLAAVGGANAGRAKTPMLTGEVGPGFTIEVVNAADKDVKTLKAGTYTIKVEDKASIHNFHLIGPGVNKMITTVGFVGTKTVVVALKKGTYRFICDPHATIMKGSFKVS